MSELTQALNVLRYFVRQTTEINSKVTSDCFSQIGSIARDSGLTSDDLILCSEFLLKKCKSSTLAQIVLKCMLPTNVVPDEAVTNVLLWMTKYYQHRCSRAIALGLQWIAGLIEFKLVNEETVQTFYPVFLELLNSQYSQVLSCWLVTRLSKPSDVERSLVLNILNLRGKAKSKCFDSVLWCFKTFKPECVPEYIPARSLVANLRINKLFKESFFQAHKRNLVHGHIAGGGSISVIWKISDGSKKRRLDTIPGVEGFRLGSGLYKKRERNLLEINELKQLCSDFWDIGIPCNSMSLLQNDFGFHLLTFRGSSLQSRFSYVLFSTLSNVIINQTVNVPLDDQELLLNKLCELCEFMQEGIPVVSRFLAFYLPYWDGFTFLPQIFKLLPWVSFSSFDELHQLYLDYIYYLFISVNVYIKCDILKVLRALVTNVAREKDSLSVKLFLHSPISENLDGILNKLLKFVRKLCVIGLNVEPESNTMLSHVLDTYEHFSVLERKYNLHVRSVLPPVAMYYSLFSRNRINLQRVCSLLLIYNTYCGIGSEHLNIAMHNHTDYILSFINDFLNILWLKKGFKKRKYGFVFRGLEESQIRVLPSHLETSLSLFKYPPLLLVTQKSDDCKVLKRVIVKVIPQVYQLLSTSLQRYR